MPSILMRAGVAAIAAASLAACHSQQPGTSGQGSNSASGASAVPASGSADADARHSALLAAAEPFEALTEQAPAASSGKLSTLVADAGKAAASVSTSLDPTQRGKLDQTLAAIKSAQGKGDRTGVALAAVEGYRTLVESASDTGPVPRAVSLLDYSGFRYQADLTASPIRWDDAAAAVSFADTQWAKLNGSITDTALTKQFTDAVVAMRKAAETQDASSAGKAVTHELDLVDKLEGYFTANTGSK